MACYRLLILGVICISFSSAEIEQNAQITVSQLTQPNSTIQATFNIEPLAKVAQNTSTQVDVKTESFAAEKKLTKFQKNKLARRLAREKKRKEKTQKVSPGRVKKINQRKVSNLSDPRVAPTKKNSDCSTKKCGANKKKFIKKAKNKKALRRKHEDGTNEHPTEGNTELEIPANIIEVMQDTSLNRFSQQENERNVRRILQNSNCYNQPADIMFVIDTSYDMVSKDFEKILNFVRESLSNLPISSAETRVGIATFDVFVNVMISFKNYSDKKLLLDAISRIASDNKTQDLQGEDYFDAAIEIFSEENGARQLFSGTQHIMVMITNDGSMMSERIANVLSQDGVEKYLIVIGEGIYTQEIQHLVSEPVMSHAYVTPNFDELQKINLDLTKQLCNEEICSNGNIIDGGITGFDLLGLMNIDENDKVTKSNGSYENATVYSVDHEVDLRINPVSLILPLGIPRYYSIIATIQMNKQASHNDWSLFEVHNTRGEVMEAVKISGQNRSVEYITMNDNMETVSVVFADAQKLFGKGFHKLTLLVTPDGVMLYIDCEVVEIITFNSSLGRPLADGEISIAKMGTFDPEIQVNLQQLDLICDVDINMSERFSCDRIGLKKDIPRTNLLLEVETSQKHHTSSETLIRGRFNTQNLAGEFQQSDNQTFQRQSHSTFTLRKTDGKDGDINGDDKFEITQSNKTDETTHNNMKVTQEQIPEEPGQVIDNDFYYQRPSPGPLTDNTTYCECPPPEYIPGPKGERGPKGEPGNDGSKGDIGPPGFPGPVGIAGRMGPPGVSGKRGLKGDKGPKGNYGPKGPDGSIGFKGAKGEPCNAELGNLVDRVKGTKGEKGNRGLPGLPGLIGDAGKPSYRMGMKGHRGDPGQRGPKGVSGPRGMRGYQGPEGKKGLAGPRGEPGVPGIDGVKGEPGPTGPQGPMGDAGKAGPKGHRGRQGYPGNPGFPGLPGFKGHEGDKGERGQQGEVGKLGLPGVPGPQGENGKVGRPGEPGPEGLRGPTGPRGDKGDTGPIGNTGETGKQGEKGDKGDKGEDGFPGEIGRPRDMDEIVAAITKVVAEMLPRYMITLQKECQRCMPKRAFPGKPGPSGPPGQNGLQGLIGHPGKDGAPGRPGAQGPEGARGKPGPRGNKGDNGARGLAMHGPMGPPGPQGPPGKPGEGIAGMPGSPGARGNMGKRGKQGRQGAAGAPGICDASDCSGAPEFRPDSIVDSPYSKGPPGPDNIREPGETLGRLRLVPGLLMHLKGPGAPDRLNIGTFANGGRLTRRSTRRP